MGEDAPCESWEEDQDPFASQWVRGIDYLNHWREASEAAAEFHRALTDAGVDPEEFRMLASTDEQGVGVARGWSSAGALRAVARLIRRGAGLPPEDEAK